MRHQNSSWEQAKASVSILQRRMKASKKEPDKISKGRVKQAISFSGQQTHLV
jgi:hypothetical protein